MFSDEVLIKKYGSWVKVQVAFYDFIFQYAMKMCPKCWKKKGLEELFSGFADGENLYERSVIAIEKAFPNFESAWQTFKKKVAADIKEIAKPSPNRAKGRKKGK